MNIFHIDFNSLKQHVIEAYTMVYGEEYGHIITKKINNSFVCFYHDIEGLESYVSYLKKCKKREYCIEFLNAIGVDVTKYNKDNYAEQFDDEIENILDNYISIFHCFEPKANYWAPILAFDPNNNSDAKRLLENKIKIINFMIQSNHEPITEDNFTDFTKTSKYLELLKEIEKLREVYDELSLKYYKWKIKLLPLEKYIEYERKRKEAIFRKKRNETFKEIFPKLPSCIKKAIANKSFEEQCDAILSLEDIYSKYNIEFFQYEQMEKLKSATTNFFEKCMIVLLQSKFLNKLGIDVPNNNLLTRFKYEDIDDYLAFINQEEIKKFIPSYELISLISSIKQKKDEEALKEYYTTGKDFTNIIKTFDNDQNTLEYIYHVIKEKYVCIVGIGATNRNNEFVSIMFYTIRVNDGGLLLFNYLHENGHIIDQNEKGCGFEDIDDFYKGHRKNSYDSNFRKYERFNETLNDIFAMEAFKYLQDKGIYLIEPKKITKLNVSNSGTSLIVKQLLYPLLEKFRKQIIKSKINVDPSELTKYIGEDNFEQLVDVVNKVDYLVRNGVVYKIENFPDDPMVIDYFEQVKRVNQIYTNIDNYYSNISKYFVDKNIKHNKSLKPKK